MCVNTLYIRTIFTLGVNVYIILERMHVTVQTTHTLR